MTNMAVLWWWNVEMQANWKKLNDFISILCHNTISIRHNSVSTTAADICTCFLQMFSNVLRQLVIHLYRNCFHFLFSIRKTHLKQEEKSLKWSIFITLTRLLQSSSVCNWPLKNMTTLHAIVNINEGQGHWKQYQAHESNCRYMQSKSERNSSLKFKIKQPFIFPHKITARLSPLNNSHITLNSCGFKQTQMLQQQAKYLDQFENCVTKLIAKVMALW